MIYEHPAFRQKDDYRHRCGRDSGGDSIPGSRQWTIVGDSARPDTISHLSNQGFNINRAEKGKGSIEDGIEFLRSFEKIIIHPRCPHVYGDFNNYKWKTDKNNNDILPIPLDASNDCIDALRYGLESYIKQNVTIFDIDYSKINLDFRNR